MVMFILKLIFVIVLGVVGVVSCASSDWFVTYSRESAAEDREARKPQIIDRSDDGCAIYKFYADHDWKYFTRCGADKTTTVKDYTVQCGKSRCERSESIDTVVNEESAK